MTVRLKRIYDEPSADDGYRALVDRLWPRGITKEKARLDEWLKALAPSDELRRWYRAAEGPDVWPAFRRRYEEELSSDTASEIIDAVARRARDGDVTLLTAVKDAETSYLSILREIVESRA